MLAYARLRWTDADVVKLCGDDRDRQAGEARVDSYLSDSQIRRRRRRTRCAEVKSSQLPQLKVLDLEAN